MSVADGFLAVLTLGPQYGSQLQGEFLARAVHRPHLNAGQVYATLERAVARGLVEITGATSDGLPLYRLTGEGDVVAAGVVAGAGATADPLWDDLLDAVLIAASLPGVDARRTVAAWRSAVDGVLAAPDAAPAERLAAGARRAQRSAALAWLDEVDTQLADDPDVLRRPLTAVRPLRGRRPRSLGDAA